MGTLLTMLWQDGHLERNQKLEKLLLPPQLPIQRLGARLILPPLHPQQGRRNVRS